MITSNKILPSHARLADGAAAEVREAMERAALIVPTWPLDRFIAVNPFWSRIDNPLSGVSAELASLSGASLLMPRACFRQQWQAGRLGPKHLRQAIVESGAHVTEEELSLLARLRHPQHQPALRGLL